MNPLTRAWATIRAQQAINELTRELTEAEHSFVETFHGARNGRTEQDLTCEGCGFVSTGWYACKETP